MGKAVACQLAEKGANVVLVARTESKLQDALEAVKVSRASVFLEESQLTLNSLEGYGG